MKKNFMMRMASCMLVMVLLTSSVISGTFAKYVTQGTSIDKARVAKWGVAIDVKGTAFAKEYDTDDTAFGEAKSVISVDNVVAPGTDGDMVSMELTGTPEVAVRVSYTGKFDIGEKWVDANGDYYCPLIIKVDTTTINGADSTSAADFEKKVNDAIKAYSKDYEAGTNLADVSGSAPGSEALAISWSWPFSTSDENDVKDTFLGDEAAAGRAAMVDLTVITTVTQID